MTSDAFKRAEEIRANSAEFDRESIARRSAEALAAHEWAAKATYIDNSDMFSRLRRANVVRCMLRYHAIEDRSPLEWGGAAAAEMGELLHLLKDVLDGRDVPVGEIADEIADTIIYLDLVAFLFDINIERAILKKFNATSERIGSDVAL